MDDQPDRAAATILASLVGTWRGRGTVSLPSMAPRMFDEIVRFTVRSSLSVDYWQRATDAIDGSMLHSEAGIWRAAGPGAFEISVALPGGTELSEGTVEDSLIALSSTTVGRATTGARLVGTTRRYDLKSEAMSYEIGIATEAFSQPGHIKGDLRRTIGGG